MAGIVEAVREFIDDQIEYSPSLLRELRDEYRSNRALARDLGIDEATVRRILAGKQSASRSTKATVEAFARESLSIAERIIDKQKSITLRVTGSINITDGKKTDYRRRDRTVEHAIFDPSSVKAILRQAYLGFEYDALADWASDFAGDGYYPDNSIIGAEVVIV